MLGSEEPGISSHQFYGALIALADGELTRAQIEAGFSIATTGDDATELSFIINTYTGIVSDDFSSIGNVNIRTAIEGLSVRTKQERYLNTLHSIFMLTEHGQFFDVWTKADVQTWLTNAAA
jgi:hypothetical protein